MPNDQQISMPNSGSGLTMFFDEDSSKIQINPKTAMLAMTILTLVVAILQGIATGGGVF